MPSRILMSSPDVGQLEEDYVVAAMRSGWIAPLGPDVDAFEDELRKRVGVDFAVALSSGTAALHLGLLGLGVKPGDVVVTSTMTFAATTNSIMYTGATPFFVDAEESTGNMDPVLLRTAMERLRRSGARVGAIVPVDLLGKTVDYTRILAIADEFGVPVLADAAESLGARHRGTAAGSFGAASVVSFNGNKIMTTSGGGMLLTNDEQLANHARYLATQARQPTVHYEHVDVGYNYRLSNLLAALGRAQLTRLDEMIGRRAAIRERYRSIFDGVDGVEIFGGGNDEEDNFWLTSIVVDPEITGWTSAQLSSALSEHNIETRPLWKPMHLQPVFEAYEGEISGASERLFHNGLTLPSGSALTPDAIDRVATALDSFLSDRS